MEPQKFKGGTWDFFLWPQFSRGFLRFVCRSIHVDMLWAGRWTSEFYIHITVHRNRFLSKWPTRLSNYPNFILL